MNIHRGQHSAKFYFESFTWMAFAYHLVGESFVGDRFPTFWSEIRSRLRQQKGAGLYRYPMQG